MKFLITFLIFVATLMQASAQPTFSVGLKWQPNSEPELTGYRLYRGTQSGKYDWKQDVGLNSQTEAHGLEPGKTYFFVVTALGGTFGSQQMESGPSNEVQYTVPGGSPVTAITGWTGKREDDKATISWDSPPADQFVGRWKVIWSVAGSTDVKESYVTNPSVVIGPINRAQRISVFITPEGAQGLGPVTLIDVPKFPDAVALEVDPLNVKLVFPRALIDP